MTTKQTMRKTKVVQTQKKNNDKIIIQEILPVQEPVLNPVQEPIPNKKQTNKTTIQNAQKSTWYKHFDRMSTIVRDTGELPTHLDIELGAFLRKQKEKYKKEVATGNIKNQSKHDIWKKFMGDHPYLFIKQDAWKKEFNNICDKIIANPETYEKYQTVSAWLNNNDVNAGKKDDDHKIGYWVKTQNTYYEKIKKILVDNNYNNVNDIPTDNNIVNIMRNEEIYGIWTEFKNGVIYRKYFMNTVDIWFDNLQKLKVYVDTHKKLPPDPSTAKKGNDDELKQLATWVATQKRRKADGNEDNKIFYDAWVKFKRDSGC